MTVRPYWILASAAVLFTSAGWAAFDPLTGVGIGRNDDGDRVDFYSHEDLVARYNKGPEVAKPYFWPVFGPGQTLVTRGWPMTKGDPGGSTDHVHQKSVWFCHGDVIPVGLELRHKIKGVEGVDFWSEAKGHGQIVCTEVGRPVFAPTHCELPTRNEWRTADGTTILTENRTIHEFDCYPSRFFAFDIDLAATEWPIVFGDTKEGSFGVRVNDAIREQVQDPKTRKTKKGDGVMENADGKVGERDCWGRQSAWCDYSGPINGEVVGLAIFDHPSNRYPASWHSRGYGLMAANPFGRAKSGFPAMRGRSDLVRLEPGEHLHLVYGLYIHTGNARDGRVDEYYRWFAASTFGAGFDSGSAAEECVIMRQPVRGHTRLLRWRR